MIRNNEDISNVESTHESRLFIDRGVRGVWCVVSRGGCFQAPHSALRGACARVVVARVARAVVVTSLASTDAT